MIAIRKSLVLDCEFSRNDARMYAEDLQLRIFCDRCPLFYATMLCTMRLEGLTEGDELRKANERVL